MTSGFHLHKEEPGLSDVLQQIKLNINANLNCHNVGRIIEFDSLTQTCTVEIMQLKQFNNTTYAPVPITQVPLIIYGGGTGHITFPNPVGTYCLLFFMDRNIDSFLETGEQYLPETTRMHDFTDCIALTTFKTLANPLSDYDEDAISVLNETIIEEIKYSSNVKVYGDSVQINSNAEEAESSNITVNNTSIASNTTDYTVTAENEISSVSTLGGQITINDKVNISNTTQNLNLLIQAFLTACEGITISGTTLTPASIQAFTNLKTQFAELLQ